MLAGNYVPEWPPIAARTGRELRPCWPGKMAICTGLVNALGKGVSQLAEVGGNLVKGLWQGIQQLAGWLWDKVSGWISSIWDGICDFFGIHSPSDEMAWIGEMLVKGLSGSIEDNGGEAVKAAEAMSSDINDVMHGLASSC